MARIRALGELANGSVLVAADDGYIALEKMNQSGSRN